MMKEFLQRKKIRQQNPNFTDYLREIRWLEYSDVYIYPGMNNKFDYSVAFLKKGEKTTMNILYNNN